MELPFIYFRFPGGELNACYNCVDRHVEAGCGDKVALIHDSPLTGVIRRVTYSELLDKVSIIPYQNRTISALESSNGTKKKTGNLVLQVLSGGADNHFGCSK